MKRIFLLAVFFVAVSVSLGAQDTTAVKNPNLVDSSLVNTSVFSLLSSEGGGSAVIDQTDQIRQAFERYNASASSRKSYGYKILVYSSNGKNARGASSGIAGQMKNTYPHLNVYRSYKAPFFMVHIGDFRTKSDAMKILHDISSSYRQAKVVRSAIGWYAF